MWTFKRQAQAWIGGVLLGAALVPAALAGGWQKVNAGAPVFGLDGRPHAASCSALPGTKPDFNFWARKGKSRDLIVYFEGGGACWDSLSCSFPDLGLAGDLPQFFTPAIPKRFSPAALGGLFNLSRGDNPVRDWHMVYVPYCTGDIHLGSATRPYQNAGNPVLPLPPQFDIRHRGYDNAMVVLDWIRRNVEAPQRILVAGSSAGGYGASVHFPWLRHLFPQAQVNVLADASQGVTTRTWDQSTPGRGSWNVQLPPWAAGIDPSTIPGPEVLRRGALAHPEVRVAQFTTAFDLVQVEFYGAMKAYYPPGGSCANPVVDWNRQMLEAMKSDRRDLPNYRHYLAAGTYHTVLTGPEFYLERSAGLPVNDWLAAMVGGSDAQRAQRWRNLACPGCLVEWPCRP